MSLTYWTVGLSLLLGLLVLALRAATPAAAAAGVVITASLMFSTAIYPYQPWRTVLPAELAVFVLAFAATRVGRDRKERLGTAEDHRGRNAAQVAANLGFAALISSLLVQLWMQHLYPEAVDVSGSQSIMLPTLAALAEAAADTVSSEIGQVAGGRPRMITTLRIAEPGTDGAITLVGTLAGVGAAAIVTAIQLWALGYANAFYSCVVIGSAVFGLFFDILLGATLERRGWLNNDGVNFLSTASAAAFALAILATIPHPGVG
jgi:uncharacterized protein (TIGR00297 family)